MEENNNPDMGSMLSVMKGEKIDNNNNNNNYSIPSQKPHQSVNYSHCLKTKVRNIISNKRCVDDEDKGEIQETAVIREEKKSKVVNESLGVSAQSKKTIQINKSKMGTDRMSNAKKHSKEMKHRKYKLLEPIVIARKVDYIDLVTSEDETDLVTSEDETDQEDKDTSNSEYSSDVLADSKIDTNQHYRYKTISDIVKERQRMPTRLESTNRNDVRESGHLKEQFKKNYDKYRYKIDPKVVRKLKQQKLLQDLKKLKAPLRRASGNSIAHRITSTSSRKTRPKVIRTDHIDDTSEDESAYHAEKMISSERKASLKRKPNRKYSFDDSSHDESSLYYEKTISVTEKTALSERNKKENVCKYHIEKVALHKRKKIKSTRKYTFEDFIRNINQAKKTKILQSLDCSDSKQEMHSKLYLKTPSLHAIEMSKKEENHQSSLKIHHKYTFENFIRDINEKRKARTLQPFKCGDSKQKMQSKLDLKTSSSHAIELSKKEENHQSSHGIGSSMDELKSPSVDTGSQIVKDKSSGKRRIKNLSEFLDNVDSNDTIKTENTSVLKKIRKQHTNHTVTTSSIRHVEETGHDVKQGREINGEKKTCRDMGNYSLDRFKIRMKQWNKDRKRKERKSKKIHNIKQTRSQDIRVRIDCLSDKNQSSRQRMISPKEVENSEFSFSIECIKLGSSDNQSTSSINVKIQQRGVKSQNRRVSTQEIPNQQKSSMEVVGQIETSLASNNDKLNNSESSLSFPVTPKKHSGSFLKRLTNTTVGSYAKSRGSYALERR